MEAGDKEEEEDVNVVEAAVVVEDEAVAEVVEDMVGVDAAGQPQGLTLTTPLTF